MRCKWWWCNSSWRQLNIHRIALFKEIKQYSRRLRILYSEILNLAQILMERIIAINDTFLKWNSSHLCIHRKLISSLIANFPLNRHRTCNYLDWKVDEPTQEPPSPLGTSWWWKTHLSIAGPLDNLQDYRVPLCHWLLMAAQKDHSRSSKSNLGRTLMPAGKP